MGEMERGAWITVEIPLEMDREPGDLLFHRLLREVAAGKAAELGGVLTNEAPAREELPPHTMTTYAGDIVVGPSIRFTYRMRP
jgi:hypothetical protein